MKKFLLIATCALQMCDIYGTYQEKLYNQCIYKFKNIIENYTKSNPIEKTQWVCGLFDTLSKDEYCKEIISFWYLLNVDQSWHLFATMGLIVTAQQKQSDKLLDAFATLFKQIKSIRLSCKGKQVCNSYEFDAAQIALLSIFLKDNCGIAPETVQIIRSFVANRLPQSENVFAAFINSSGIVHDTLAKQ